MADQHANWLALLKWSLAQTSDGTRQSEFTAMKEEDRQFLEQVMKEVTSEPEKLRKIMEDLIAKLGTESTTRNEETEILLDNLLDIVEQIDMAQVFVKFGGVRCLLQTAKEHGALTSDCRGSALSVIGTLAQNNLVVQRVLLAQNVLEELLSFSSEGGVTWAKALYAISCTVRGFPEGEEVFMERYAGAVLSTLQDTEKSSAAACRRCVYFALSLISEHPERIDKILPYLSPNFGAFLASEDLDLREGTLKFMASAARTVAGKEVIRECLGLFTELRSRQSDFFGSDEQRYFRILIRCICI